MSIAPLKKLTLAGPAAQKRATLAHLQGLGCMHLVPLSRKPAEPETAPTREAEDAWKALRFLAPLAGKRRQITRDTGFDVHAFVARTLDLKERLRAEGDRRDALAARLALLEPWGDLPLPPPGTLGGLLLWFYELPVRQRPALDTLDLPWEIVAQDQRHLYVALVSAEEPPADLLPVPRVHVGSKPRAVLMQELEEAEVALEEMAAERLALTRYLTLFRARLSEAETRAELEFAEHQTRDADALFAVQGWVPEAEIARVEALAETAGLALLIEEAAWNEIPPTKLDRPETDAAGVDLAMFYQVPSSRGWDPALLLMASFALFFAMIVADAGYGLVILGGLLAGWTRLGASPHRRAWRRMGLVLAGATIGYGALVGSYFGAAPPEGSLLAGLVVLSLDDFETMMRLSILVGAAHIAFAIAMNAWVNRERRFAIAQLGWIAAIAGGLTLWLSGNEGAGAIAGTALLTGGLGAVVLFTSDRPVAAPLDWAWRLVDGLGALGGAMGAFGDVLSYMRLFALGLASASLALTFNDLATQTMEAVPGLGVLLGVLILAVGHALNFALAMMSGVVHGLRLNYIEFFKWGLPEEGVAFRPLAVKEVQE